LWLIETDVFQLPQLHKHLNVKYLQFEGMIYGFEQINKKYSCGTTKQNAVFRLWQFKKEQFFRIQFAN